MAYPHLLGLPRELRDIILHQVVPERIKLMHSTYEDNVTFFNNHGILLANHQLRNEAIEAIYRQPDTTIIWSRKSRVSLLACPDYIRLRETVQKLVVQTEYWRSSPERFLLLLSRNKDVDDGLSLKHITQCMPALREITCEIIWAPNDTASVLLPEAKNIMTTEFRRVTIGSEHLPDWKVEVRVVDSTRWEKSWSGLLIARKI